MTPISILTAVPALLMLTGSASTATDLPGQKFHLRVSD
jgi:hypothetical protein